jgi:hypothetical protein
VIRWSLLAASSSSGHSETGYYRITRDHEDDYYREKVLWPANSFTSMPAEKPSHVFIGDSKWEYKHDNDKHQAEFRQAFEFVPEGTQERQEQINGLIAEIDNMDKQLGVLDSQAISFTPHVEGENISTGTSLAHRAVTSMAQAKVMVATVRNNAMKLKKDMVLKSKRLQAIVSEQSKAMQIRVKEMEGVIAKMEEAVWTINLYLGKNEEIHRLTKGQPAPPETKIIIRQSVLFMDEESALFARSDGIDIRQIEDFDNWLLEDPTHLQQVIPDQKGIVALHVRRHGKNYEDPWMNTEMNTANLRWTYFLIKNGDNLYRVYVDIDVGRHLFPTVSEI